MYQLLVYMSQNAQVDWMQDKPVGCAAEDFNKI